MKGCGSDRRNGLLACQVKRLVLGRDYQGMKWEGIWKACQWGRWMEAIRLWRARHRRWQLQGPQAWVSFTLHSSSIVRLLSQFSGRQWGKKKKNHTVDQWLWQPLVIPRDKVDTWMVEVMGGQKTAVISKSPVKHQGLGPPPHTLLLCQTPHQSSKIHRNITRGKTVSSKMCSHS